MFSAEVHNLRGVPVVEAAGEIDLSTVPELSAAVGRAARELRQPEGSLSPLVLDLSRVSFMECRGLWFLIEHNRRLRESGGGLRLVLGGGNEDGRSYGNHGGDRGALEKLLRLTGLEEEFATYPEAESAVAGAPRR